MQNEVIEKVKSAELLLDGSTDVSTTEKEIVYVRVIKDGIPLNAFLGLTDGTAVGIAAELD